jgi:hypothetical protein
LVFGVLSGLIILTLVFGVIRILTVNPPLAAPGGLIRPDNKIAGQEAYNLALEKAKAWRTDAVLAYLASGAMVESDRADSWRLIFISPGLKNKGYEIKINDKRIIASQEIDYAGQGEDFPVATRVTQEQAVEKVRAMAGYEQAKILSVDAVYGSGTKTWYWGVKTDKGIVSIEMK